MPPVAADRAHSFAVAQAHAHGVRFHVKADVHPGDLADIGAAAALIAAKVRGAFADGINFDLESPMADAQLVGNYTLLVLETAALLRRENPAAVVTVDVPWSPADIDGRSYDWGGLAAAADLLFVMVRAAGAVCDATRAAADRRPRAARTSTTALTD